MRKEILAWASYILVTAVFLIQMSFQNLHFWICVAVIIVSLILRVAASKGKTDALRTLKIRLQSFTFGFIIVGIIVVMYNLSGQDDKNIVMIGLNPILVALDNPVCRPILNEIPYSWHLLSLVSMTLYGTLFDFLKYFFRRKRK